jgi:phosphoribosylamine--glycine ligase
MNILVIGSGGREHALTWKLKESPHCDEIYVTPGNGGTALIANNLNIQVNEFDKISDAVRVFNIGMVVVGPEDPLVNGIYEKLSSDHPDLQIIGPDSQAAQLEGSKSFAKDFMNQYAIPTAKAEVFTESNLEKGKLFLESLNPPYVLKADGLAAGKGVIITSDLDEAKKTLDDLIIKGQFGDASKSVLIEEFLEGIELSVFVLTDGTSYKILPSAKDYKRIGENDTGPNTGGMGAVSPVIFADESFMEKVEERVIKPTIKGIQEKGFNYKGFIFIGLMNRDGDPYVIEYNVRMGDPETQVVIPRIKSDLVELLSAAAQSKLSDSEIELFSQTATTVVLVSEGYPGKYEKGKEIEIGNFGEGTLPFHAGTLKKGGKQLTNGGRVMAITALGDSLKSALALSYSGVGQVSWDGLNYRSDIGKDLMDIGQS